MFITYDAYMSKDLEDDDRTAWNIVQRCGHTPWFQVGYMGTLHDRERFTCALLARDLYALAYILKLQDDDNQVVSVQVVLPSWITGEPAWCMRQLVEVKCLRDNDGVPVVHYTVESGQTYLECTSEAVLLRFPGHPHVIYHDAPMGERPAERLVAP